MRALLAIVVLSSGVAAHAQSWSMANDYPVRALREGREGTAAFRVTVNEAGRVEACQITASSGSADLDAATCEIITRRGRFKPATDAAGKPVKANYASKVRWTIPRDPPAPEAPIGPAQPAPHE